MKKDKQIKLLPIDNRPVSYLLPKQIAEFSGIDLNLPEREKLGDLKKGSDLSYIDRWVNDIPNNSCLILSLDNWIYGGLVQSRKHLGSLEELKKRALGLININKVKKYGFSSIMRIPSHNNTDEEKDYWKKYGEKIHNWSKLMYMVGRGIKEGYSTHEELIEKWYQCTKEIPARILADYKGHRDKNLSINMFWLESMHQQSFNYLIFSSDDSSKYGLNVAEAEHLKNEIIKHNFKHSVKVMSGTDEIPLVLLTKSILDSMSIKPSVSVYFNSIEGANQIARYESNTIKTSVLNQLETLDLNLTDFEKSDIVLFIHVADSQQGDHVFEITPKDTENNACDILNILKKSQKPFIIADLAYANGADPKFISLLLNTQINWRNCYGYSAWNTCSNTIGSALAIGINRWIAEKNNTFNEIAFKKCLLTRFLDDYAYQAEIRNSNISEETINGMMKKYVQKFSRVLRLDNIDIKCKLPWNRSFEIELVNVI